MKLLLKRQYKKLEYTIGKLYIDGKYFCDTIEDTVRDLHGTNGKAKIYAKTAIPEGTYKVTMDVVSPKFRNVSWAKPYGGKVPRLLNVPYFEGILIHVGNTEKNSAGCIIIGQNKIKGQVINSVETFHNLMKELLKDKNNITIEIQ